MVQLKVIRGIPGSGKSYLSAKLGKEIDAVVISTDDFFMVNGEYKFDYRYISVAHKWCHGIVAYNLMRGKSVIVNNTFTCAWEIVPYIDMAHQLGIVWEILEPTTKWRYNVEECVKRNTHNVPEATIQKMMDRFEKTSDLLKAFEKYRGS